MRQKFGRHIKSFIPALCDHVAEMEGVPVDDDCGEQLQRKTVCPSSCDEDRLGLSEQPSEEQCRASHLRHEDGHTVLR